MKSHDLRNNQSPGHNDRGATSSEYAILISLIAAVIIAAVALLGENLVALFESVVF